MGIITNIALFFHLMGFASLFGVSAVQVRQPLRIAKNGMLHGALTQLVSGMALVALNREEVNHAVAGIKLFILFIILSILFYYRRDTKREIPSTPFFVVFGLTFVEVILAITYMG